MSKETIYIPMKLGDKFNVAFPDGFVPEGIVDKSKCRVGITYQAFHEPRHTIVVVPTEQIIADAKLNYEKLNLFGIHDGVSTDDVKNYLASGAKYLKIVSTPDSFWKIVTAAKELKKLNWLYAKIFLYLDEYHCYASEAFRERILTPFDNGDVWKFKKLCFGSATPYPLSDPNFKKLQRYKLTYEEKFGTIHVIHDKHPLVTLQYMIQHAEEYFPGPVCIMFNSVTQSGITINNTGITDAAVFCRNEERNMVNLQEASVYYQDQPRDGEYKKFNFFSRRYDEGWALRGENMTMILVTDIHSPHTLVGIPFQGFQAIGRLEQAPYKIYHITNNYEKESMKEFITIEQGWQYNAKNNIAYHNQQLKARQDDGIQDDGGLKEFVKRYTKFKPNGEAELYHTKLDQVVCAEWIKQHYSNKSTIVKAWEDLNYNVVEQTFCLQPIVRVHKTKENVNRQIIERYLHWKRNHEQYAFELASEAISKDKVEFKMLFEALAILGKQEMERLNYNDEAMKKELIQVSNRNAETKIRLALINDYKLDGKYTKVSMKQRLQQLYNEYGIKKANGKPEVATAKQFDDFGLFQMKECKANNEQGESKPGFQIIKLLYTLNVPA